MLIGVIDSHRLTIILGHEGRYIVQLLQSGIRSTLNFFKQHILADGNKSLALRVIPLPCQCFGQALFLEVKDVNLAHVSQPDAGVEGLKLSLLLNDHSFAPG